MSALNVNCVNYGQKAAHIFLANIQCIHCMITLEIPNDFLCLDFVSNFWNDSIGTRFKIFSDPTRQNSSPWWKINSTRLKSVISNDSTRRPSAVNDLTQLSFDLNVELSSSPAPSALFGPHSIFTIFTILVWPRTDNFTRFCFLTTYIWDLIQLVPIRFRNPGGPVETSVRDLIWKYGAK